MICYKFIISIKPAVFLFGLTLAPFYATPCCADDAQDAVELLTDSLNCNHYKPDVSPLVRSLKTGERNTIVSLTVSKYLGDTRQLIVVEETTRDAHDYKETYKTTLRANFANLDSNDIRFEHDEGYTVGVACLQHLDCITVKDGHSKQAKTNMSGFRVCDSETAERVKFEIETLINLNRSSAKPVLDKPAAARPAPNKKASHPTPNDSDYEIMLPAGER
jgi:hypothetical protein